MKTLEERAQEIADELEGTVLRVPDYSTARAEEWDNPKLMELVYEKVFECECCGWWCSVDELHEESGEQHCDECAATNDE